MNGDFSQPLTSSLFALHHMIDYHSLHDNVGSVQHVNGTRHKVVLRKWKEQRNIVECGAVLGTMEAKEVLIGYCELHIL